MSRLDKNTLASRSAPSVGAWVLVRNIGYHLTTGSNLRLLNSGSILGRLSRTVRLSALLPAQGIGTLGPLRIVSTYERGSGNSPFGYVRYVAAVGSPVDLQLRILG